MRRIKFNGLKKRNKKIFNFPSPHENKRHSITRILWQLGLTRFALKILRSNLIRKSGTRAIRSFSHSAQTPQTPFKNTVKKNGEPLTMYTERYRIKYYDGNEYDAGGRRPRRRVLWNCLLPRNQGSLTSAIKYPRDTMGAFKGRRNKRHVKRCDSLAPSECDDKRGTVNLTSYDTFIITLRITEKRWNDEKENLFAVCMKNLHGKVYVRLKRERWKREERKLDLTFSFVRS